MEIITKALDYLNGNLHLGHMLEATLADIYARHRRNYAKVIFIGGGDAHGTPIMLKARSLQIEPQQLVQEMQKTHNLSYQKYGISFDVLTNTDSDYNRELTYQFYNNLLKNNDLEEREIEQAYDESEQMFLPDRFVKGNCPKCGASDQYGDSCEKCGATYNVLELKNPRSVLSNTAPSVRSTKHAFFNLAKYQDFLSQWLTAEIVDKNSLAKLQEWFADKLQSWDITRDAPYFGFNIPDRDQQFFLCMAGCTYWLFCWIA